MKITIKTPKPRNPIATPARQRKAGAHHAYHPARRTRRAQKQSLRQLLSGRDTEGNVDA